MEILFDHLGHALRWLRETRGRRQYEVAEAAGVTKAMLSAYETGRQKPSLDNLERVLRALDVHLGDLEEALQLMRQGSRRRFALAGLRRPAPSTTVPGIVAETSGSDLYGILGSQERLPPAKEEALGEMLDGFHKLIRYLGSGHECGRESDEIGGIEPD